MVESENLVLPLFEQITIPLKNTNDFDWKSQLKLQIMEMGENPKSFCHQIDQFNNLRKEAVSSTSNKHRLEKLICYYRQLDNLSSKINAGKNVMALEFSWSDAFDSSILVKQSSIAFEKANLLFNIGASFSQYRDSDDKARYFQASASTFAHIGENFLHPPLEDISKATVIFLSKLMLGQAQEAVVLKSVNEKKSESTIAKLASSVLEYYKDANDRLSGSEMASMRSFLLSNSGNCDRDAFSLLQHKFRIWRVIAEYYAALSLYSSSKIGDAISRLKAGITMCKEAIDLCEFDERSVLVQFTKNLYDHCGVKLKVWEKDNCLIYVQTVPSHGSLPSLESISLVNVNLISEAWKSIRHEGLIFSNLLTIFNHEQLSEYSEEKSKLLRYETMKVTTCDNEFQTTLASLGFPSTFDKMLIFLREINAVPEPIINLRKKCIQTTYDLKNSNNIEIVVSEVKSILEKGLIDLTDEINLAQCFRLDFSYANKQSPSHIANAKFFETISQIESNLSILAQDHEKKIMSLKTPDLEFFELITSDCNKFQIYLPWNSEESQELKIQRADSLERMLKELDQLTKDRSKLLEKLRQDILNENPTQLNLSKNETKCNKYEEELSKFDEQCVSIEENIDHHNEIMKKFLTEWQLIASKFDMKKIEDMQKSYIERLAKTSSIMHVYQSEIKLLYEKTLSLKLEAMELYSDIKNFCHFREKERETIKLDLETEVMSKNHDYLLSKLESLSSMKNSSDSSSVIKPIDKFSSTILADGEIDSIGLVKSTNEPCLLD